MFTNKMICQIDEYMLYCQSKQLSEKTMESYEQTKKMNCPERRRDFRQPVSVTTIKDYSTDAVLFYPGLSYAFFSVLENKCAIFHLKYMKLHGNMKLIRLLLCMDTILNGETCLKSEMVVL